MQYPYTRRGATWARASLDRACLRSSPPCPPHPYPALRFPPSSAAPPAAPLATAPVLVSPPPPPCFVPRNRMPHDRHPAPPPMDSSPRFVRWRTGDDGAQGRALSAVEIAGASVVLLSLCLPRSSIPRRRHCAACPSLYASSPPQARHFLPLRPFAKAPSAPSPSLPVLAHVPSCIDHPRADPEPEPDIFPDRPTRPYTTASILYHQPRIVPVPAPAPPAVVFSRSRLGHHRAPVPPSLPFYPSKCIPPTTTATAATATTTTARRLVTADAADYRDTEKGRARALLHHEMIYTVSVFVESNCSNRISCFLCSPRRR
ncbi:hypothetical protein C2E23DRAFT_194088 [Lenzites betulinus]|nr:hypothetical protein C2E23DRAFT_194088 [Lenzites betulinus]